MKRWQPTLVMMIGALAVGLALAGLVVSDGERLAVVATAMATILLAIFTAQLYQTTFAQMLAASRPLLVEVKPFAPPPADLGAKVEEATSRPIYFLEYPDDPEMVRWDGRRTHVDWATGSPIRISVVLRNIGTGLAVVDESGLRASLDDINAAIEHRRVRYRHLPPGESTRVNLVLRSTPPSTKQRLAVAVPYTDLSGQVADEVHLMIAPTRSRAWTRDPEDDMAWTITDVTYIAGSRGRKTPRRR